MRWTGIGIFPGVVFGPVIGGVGDESTAVVFKQSTPEPAFLLPSFAVVTIAGGIVSALGFVTLLSVQGFGFRIPGEARMYLEMRSENPDAAVIVGIGRQNAKLGGVQGRFQLVLVLVMVCLRFGGV